MTKEAFMVEIDRREDSDLRLDDVGRIKAASQAHFVDGKFSVVRLEGYKGNRRDALEKRGMRGELAVRQKGFDCGVHARPCRREILVRNILAIDPYAFVDSFKVWRRKKPG